MITTSQPIVRRPHASLRRGSWQKGCLIAFVVVFVIAIGLAVTVALTWRRMFAASVTIGVTEMVSTSQLPQDQKDRIMAKVGNVTEDFKSGKITLQQFGKVFEAVFDGPLLPLTMMWGAQEKYFDKSGLSEEEKAAGVRAMHRFSHGVAEGKLSMDDLSSAMQHVSTGANSVTVTKTNIDGSVNTTTTRTGGNFQFKPKVSDEELRKFIEEIKTKADGAHIAEDVPEMNIAEEVEKAIDKGLANSK